jgi:hypothetical protein
MERNWSSGRPSAIPNPHLNPPPQGGRRKNLPFPLVGEGPGGMMKSWSCDRESLVPIPLRGGLTVPSRPQRGRTYQPRASPWGPKGPGSQHHPERVERNQVVPFQGTAAAGSNGVPRAMPWAFMSGPFRAKRPRAPRNESQRFPRTDRRDQGHLFITPGFGWGVSPDATTSRAPIPPHVPPVF